jgi:S1-C subfamily serine protease
MINLLREKSSIDTTGAEMQYPSKRYSHRTGRFISLVLLFVAPCLATAQSGNDYLKAGDLAADITVQIMTSDFSGKNFSRKIGAGTIIDQTGIVVTCSHVLGTHYKVRVRLANGNQYACEVLGRFPEHDLAVLKFEPKEKLKVAPRLHEGLLSPDTPVICLGYPRGKMDMVPASVKLYLPDAGIELLAKGTPAIIFDGAIEPGYSGGPIMTLDGGIIGVVFGKNRQSGVGLAIPIRVLKADLKRIEEAGGKIEEPPAKKS